MGVGGPRAALFFFTGKMQKAETPSVDQIGAFRGVPESSGNERPCWLPLPQPPGLATPSLDTAARLSPDLRGAAPPPAGSVSPEGHRQSPGGKALARAGDRSGQAASPAQDGGAAVPAALSAARCPLTPLTRCGQAELPRPAWHPCPCPAPPPHRRRREGSGLASFNYNGSKDVTSGAATCYLPPPGPWVESDD